MAGLRGRPEARADGDSDMSIKHAFVSAKADGGDATQVRPSNWNEAHVLQTGDNETPSGTINGTTGSDGNPTFTLAHAPSPAGSLILVLNGLTYRAGLHFTLSSLTITYQTGYIPVAGDWHRAWYRYDA